MKTRAYCLVNQYIAGIHAGIQSAHAIADMLTYYRDAGNVATSIMHQWATKDKTIIVLDGGPQSSLREVVELMRQVPSLPQASFHEELDALNGALTAVCIVLPEYMYNPQYIVRADSGEREIANKWVCEATGNTMHWYSGHEKVLIEKIKSFRLKTGG